MKRSAEAALPRTQMAFGAVSIKPYSAGPGMPVGGVDTDPAGLHWHGATLREMIRKVYGLDEDQLLGGEPWTQIDRFAVDAVTQTPESNPQVLFAMMRSVLEERFHLRLAVGKKKVEALALTLGPSGPSGLHLKPLAEDESPHLETQPPPGKAVAFLGATVSAMVSSFNNPWPQLDKMLVDHTGLNGRYNIVVIAGYDEITVTEEMRQRFPEMPPNAHPHRLRRDEIPSALKALGFALEPTTIDRDVYTIQSATEPTPN